MILLTHGDRIPAVGVMQRMLNLTRSMDARLSTVPEVREDAFFGRDTREALVAAQRGLSIADDGALGPESWRELAGIAKFRVVHVVDRAIEHMFATLGRAGVAERARERYRSEHENATDVQADSFAEAIVERCQHEIALFTSIADGYRGIGGDPIEITSMTDPLTEIRRGIASRSRDGWKVVILRIVAHGGPARQIIACSPFGSYTLDTDLMRFDDDDSPSEIVETILLNSMTVGMANFGCLELHGCNIARRLRPERRRGGAAPRPPTLSGRPYVQALANAVSHAATAALGSQRANGSTREVVRYEGQTVSSYPGGATAEEWFAARVTLP
ncbi:MAG: hypothetical protein AAGJ28_17925 [Pseudomonadota bacterium]